MSTQSKQNQSSVLTSWKEIANYFGKGVRTVQRWEERFNLPVRRPDNTERHIVATTEELDQWVKHYWKAPEGGASKTEASAPATRHSVSITHLNLLMERYRELKARNFALRQETAQSLEMLLNNIGELNRTLQSARRPGPPPSDSDTLH